MANDEWKAQRQNSQATYSVPTPAMFGGDFSALGTTIYDPATGGERRHENTVSGGLGSLPTGSTRFHRNF